MFKNPTFKASSLQSIVTGVVEVPTRLHGQPLRKVVIVADKAGAHGVAINTKANEQPISGTTPFTLDLTNAPELHVADFRVVKVFLRAAADTTTFVITGHL